MMNVDDIKEVLNDLDDEDLGEIFSYCDSLIEARKLDKR